MDWLIALGVVIGLLVAFLVWVVLLTHLTGATFVAVLVGGLLVFAAGFYRACAGEWRL